MDRATLIGSQVPTYQWVPEYTVSSGPEAVAFAAECGIDADPWQDNILTGSMGEIYVEGVGWQWSANQVGVIVGRQNGKGTVLEARELYGLFCLGEKRIIHSAHQFSTAMKAFTRMQVIIESNPDLDRCCMAMSGRGKGVVRSKGSEGFTFKIDGQWRTLEYVARSESSGRGFDQTSLVVLDEAMILDEGPIAALLPTMSAAPGGRWQVWYTASAGDRRLRSESRVLARIRRLGYAQKSSLAFYEWAAHLKHGKGCQPDAEGNYDHPLDLRDDPRTWAKTMPSMGIRRERGPNGATAHFLGEMMAGMETWDFDREFLGVGDYPEPDGWSVFSAELWNTLADRGARGAGAPDVLSVGVELEWDRSAASVSIVGRRPDGRMHVEMIETRPGYEWVPEYCKALKKNRRPVRIVVDPKGPADVVVPGLRAAVGNRILHLATLDEFKTWCATFLGMIQRAEIRHLAQPTLDAAVKHTKKRALDGGLRYVWERADVSGPVAPFNAATMALGGWIITGGKRPGGNPLVGAA